MGQGLGSRFPEVEKTDVDRPDFLTGELVGVAQSGFDDRGGAGGEVFGKGIDRGLEIVELGLLLGFGGLENEDERVGRFVGGFFWVGGFGELLFLFRRELLHGLGSPVRVWAMRLVLSCVGESVF